MGPNGAGKSTVLKAVMGIAPVAEGDVFWRGEPLSAATHEIVKRGISFVPQGRRVFTHLTIEENLEMGCLYLGDRVEKAAEARIRNGSVPHPVPEAARLGEPDVRRPTADASRSDAG